MNALRKFKVTKNDDQSFDLESLESGNKINVQPTNELGMNRSYKVVLWTVLSDLYDDGLLGNDL